MELTTKKLAELKPAQFNPTSRTSDTALRTLLKSIKEHGILQPLLVSEKGEIIDGHRRLACAKALKLETVPVVVSNHSADMSVAEKFETVNTHMKKLGCGDMIFVYCNGGAVPKRIEAKIATLEVLLGADRLDQISALGISYRVGDDAARIAAYCGQTRNDQFKQAACNWLIDNHMLWRANRAMEMGVPAKTIKKAIEKNKPLAHSWGIAGGQK